MTVRRKCLVTAPAAHHRSHVHCGRRWQQHVCDSDHHGGRHDGSELTIPADYTAECSDELILDDATATDNCTVCSDAFDFTSTVEGYGLSFELVASHEGGELDGMRTYRVYLDGHSDDQVTSFTGNDEFALSLNTTTSFSKRWWCNPQRFVRRCDCARSRVGLRQLRHGWLDRSARRSGGKR